jgi:hypothetical protein
MTTFININTPPICKVEVKAGNVYHLITPSVQMHKIEVKGLFPSTFNGSQIIAENITPPEANDDFINS